MLVLAGNRGREEDHADLSRALGGSEGVNQQEKRRRLEEVHARTDAKAAMRMRSGQIFTREDLLRKRRLLHEGALQLKNQQGRMKGEEEEEEEEHTSGLLHEGALQLKNQQGRMKGEEEEEEEEHTRGGVMEERQLMADLEAELKDLEADSWTSTVDQSLLDSLSREQAKRQDVIYELMQTELHHVRTLRIMAEVYGRGVLKEGHVEPAALDKMFPGLEHLLEIHTLLLRLLLERRPRRCNKGSSSSCSSSSSCCEGARGTVVLRVGDLLLGQFSGSCGEEVKRVYGRFCGGHNEAVNFYKDLLSKDKRFQAFVKVRLNIQSPASLCSPRGSSSDHDLIEIFLLDTKKLSSVVVRRLGVPECLLLVTQRITKYPVLIQRILQHTDEAEEDHADLSRALGAVKEVIAAVDQRVNQQEKRRRLEEVHARTDAKAAMRMRSGQIFTREDLLRKRRLLHEGALQLKNQQGRMKGEEEEEEEEHTRSTVVSLQNLIVREVANEERGIFLISAGAAQPEMLEVVASCREERDAWMLLLQDAMDAA
ncbi:hypothetical protein CRUP_016779 [Coryphaenoides rupestris]|nr:hypothetical protein CRUP_016779 [Coryphaenoides rupestris]